MTDIGKAFSAPFKDPDWGAKFLVGSLMVLLCIFGLPLFVLLGYFIQCTQRVMRREEYPLPAWNDLGVKFVIGFKYAIAILLYILPLLLLAVPMMVLFTMSAIADSQGIPALLASVYGLGFVLLAVPYGIALTLLMPIISYRFALRESIADALDIAAVFRAFSRHWESTLVVALLVVGVESFAGIGALALFIGLFFTMFYAYLVGAYLHGLLYLDHQHTEEVVPV